jgi:hypothetical protein
MSGLSHTLEGDPQTYFILGRRMNVNIVMLRLADLRVVKKDVNIKNRDKIMIRILLFELNCVKKAFPNINHINMFALFYLKQ